MADENVIYIGAELDTSGIERSMDKAAHSISDKIKLATDPIDLMGKKWEIVNVKIERQRELLERMQRKAQEAVNAGGLSKSQRHNHGGADCSGRFGGNSACEKKRNL